MSVSAGNLKEKIDNRTATIGVIGLGYVGLPLAVEYALAGFRTVGIDTHSGKVESLKAGHNYIADIPADRWEKVKQAGLFITG